MTEYRDQDSGLILLEVTKVTSIPDNNLLVRCKIQDSRGNTEIVNYPYSPGDIYGVAKLIGLWLTDNKGKYVIQDTPASKVVEDDVNRERERRVLLGCYVGPIRITGDTDNMRNITNLGAAAKVRVDFGDNSQIKFRDAFNNNHLLTQQQMMSLWLNSIKFVSDLYEISWKMKELSPIPVDYKNDIYWLTAIEKDGASNVHAAK